MGRKQNPNAQKRHWMHTIHFGHLGLDESADDEDFHEAMDVLWHDLAKDTRCRYASGQLERGEQGRLHAQVYTEWTTSLRRRQVMKVVPSDATYRTGTRKQCRDYVRKAEGREFALEEIGEWRPERGDDDFGQVEGPKARALRMVMEGLHPMQIAVEDPEAYFTFHRSIVALWSTLEHARQEQLYGATKPATIGFREDEEE